VTPKIAVNLYSAREAMGQDLEGTLTGIASIGYRFVEMAGYHGHSPQAFKELLDANRLQAVSAHVPIERFENELDTVIAEGKLFGLDALVVPWLSPEQREFEFVRELPIKLNAWGEEIVKAGMRLAYHNHDFEYGIDIDGRSLMEVLLADAHPDHVDLEPDLFWIADAGLDPIRELKEMHPRVRMLHAKDRSADGTFANVGAGTFDWETIIAVARAAMVEYLIVEHDQPSDLIADLGESYRFLDELLSPA
jgi:sugar phosphate isomerase/epimerase